MVSSFRLYIGGKWANSRSGETFSSLNPATGKPIASFQKAGEDDVNRAVDVAGKAQKKWKDVPAPKRGEILLRFAYLLKQHKEELAQTVTLEMGKVLTEARGDVQEAIDTAEYFAGEGRRLFGHTTPSELRNKFAMTIRMPVGVFGIITPWNFPIAIPAWKIMPALVCGNAVVFKPASDTPLCATKFVELLIKAGVPSGVVNLVTGPGDPTGTAIVKHKGVRGISFTGNRETGESILKNAGLKKVGLELGGKNGIIIMPDAPLELALDGVIWGGFGTTGQRCTAASRVIVDEKIRGKFERIFVDRAKRLRLGPGINPKTDVGPLINKAAVDKARRYTQIGLEEGAKLLCGGKPHGKAGFFYQPTVFTDVAPDMKIAQEEIFGPVVSIISVKNIDEAIDAMNSVRYGLSSSIYTRDINAAFRAIHEIEAGITYVNAPTIGAEVHLPFGGVKETGIGTREAGIEGINEFSETKTVYIDYSGRLQRAQIDAD
ncbi:MAG: aldehyde dehydrogenase family protein [Candidatus Aenigmarchaeota archaeon]|nr:aldehyde dehydrogenase family protein [Candidatus Aenigmarchaeota archaeon]